MSLSSILAWLASTGATAALLGAAVWFGREWIGGWLSRSIQHTYDTKLETVRAELRAREAEIAALREGALASVNTRNSTLIQKRVEAVDRIWAAVIELNKHTMAVKWLQSVKFEEASAQVERDPKVKEFFATLHRTSGGTVDFNLEQKPEHARPYVSEYVWALYSTYSTVIMLANVKMKLLSDGLDGRRFFNFKSADDALKTALPHYTKLIDDHGGAVHGLIIDELRDKILTSLREVLAGHEDDKATIAKAASILKATAEAQTKIAEPPPTTSQGQGA